MTTMLQLPGFGQGLLTAPVAEAGDEAALQAEVLTDAGLEQLQQLLDELRAAGDPLASELEAMLIPLLQDGMLLPPGGGPGGVSMPPFAALAQAVLGGQAQDKGEAEPVSVRGAKAPGLTGTVTLAGELPEELSGNDADIGVDSEWIPGARVVREVFDRLLEQSGNRPLSVNPPPPGPGGPAFAVAGPGNPAAMSIPSSNLLSMPVPQPVSDPAWGAAIGERLVWMAKGDHQMAELKITPPNLGTIEVRLNINHDQASVSFVSHHAQVRDAIESALPRLREMLAEQSLNLVQTDVSSGRQGDPGRSQGGREGMSSGGAAGGQDMGAADGSVGGGTESRSGLGLLDLFA